MKVTSRSGTSRARIAPAACAERRGSRASLEQRERLLGGEAVLAGGCGEGESGGVAGRAGSVTTPPRRLRSSGTRVELPDGVRLGRGSASGPLGSAARSGTAARRSSCGTSRRRERLPPRGVLADLVEMRAAVGERAVERVGDALHGLGLRLGELAAHRPHRVDERQAGPRLPLGAEVVRVQVATAAPSTRGSPRRR